MSNYQDGISPRKILNPWYSNVVLLLFAVTGILIVSQNFVLLPMSAQLQAEFHIEHSFVFLSTSIFSFCYACGFLAWTVVVKKYGKRKVLILGLLFTACFTACVGLVHNYAIFCLLRGLQGLSSATFTPIALHYGLELFNNKKMIILSTALTASPIVSQLLSRLTIKFVTVSELFLLVSIIIAGLTIMYGYLLPKDIEQHERLKIGQEYRQVYRVLLNPKYRWLFGMIIIQFFYFVMLLQIIQNLSTKQNISISPTTIQFVSLIGILISPLLAPILNRIGKKLIIVFLIINLGGFSLLMLSSKIYCLYIAILCISFSVSSTLPLLIQEVGKQIKNNLSYGMASYTFLLFLGSSIGTIFSAVFDMTINFIIVFSTLIIATYYSFKQDLN
ncbi:MFS transporter [Lysinibacillus sp. NPDC093688]|uniref:MFS transporter n=1 Tax=Lysinibacillus sp. NPDC093688 TaxID=3390577 RepID=UPI003CFE69EE